MIKCDKEIKFLIQDANGKFFGYGAGIARWFLADTISHAYKFVLSEPKDEELLVYALKNPPTHAVEPFTLLKKEIMVTEVYLDEVVELYRQHEGFTGS